MRRTSAVLSALLLAGPAAACINDVELSTHEREFRSQYNKPAPPPEVASPGTAEPSGPSPYAMTAGAGGLILLAGAAILTVRGPSVRG